MPTTLRQQYQKLINMGKCVVATVCIVILGIVLTIVLTVCILPIVIMYDSEARHNLLTASSSGNDDSSSTGGRVISARARARDINVHTNSNANTEPLIPTAPPQPTNNVGTTTKRNEVILPEHWEPMDPTNPVS